MKIQKRLLFSILPVVFFTVITVTGVAVYISTNVVESQVKANAELVSQSYSNQLEAKIVQTKRMSLDLASAVVTAVNVETVLLDARKRYPEISQLLYTNISGNVIDLAPYNKSLLPYNFKDSIYFNKAFSSNLPVLSDPVDFQGSKQFYLYTPVTISYVAGRPPQVIGILIMILPADYLINDFDKVVIGDTGSIFIVNSEGKFISYKNPSYIMNKKVIDLPSTTDLSKIQYSMVNQQKGIGTYYQKSERNFISFAPIPSTEWSLALSGSYSEFSNKINTIMSISFGILFFSLIFATIIIYLIVSGVVKPITHLTDMADRITHGEMSLRSEIKINNEIGVLSTAFDDMVDRLENYNKVLEIAVSERTQELQVANEELQSMNESIETINEELTATNEALDLNSKEMEAMNEELIVSNEALDQKNRDMESLNEELITTVKELKQTKDALWTEMELAQKLQTVLLPQEPKIDGFDISAFMRTTDSVGGDYYDVINVGDKDWFLIGDVSGHGVTAGLIMMMVQTSIHVALSQNPHSLPGSLLSIINKTIHSNISKLGGNRYMTLTVFACMDKNKFSFAGAHLPLILYRSKNKSIEYIDTPGAWIGLVEDIQHLNSNNEFFMEKDDVILLYTDGISEALLQDGSSFNQKSLGELFYKYAELDSKSICNEIRAHSDTLILDDDVTVMVLKKV